MRLPVGDTGFAVNEDSVTIGVLVVSAKGAFSCFESVSDVVTFPPTNTHTIKTNVRAKNTIFRYNFF